MEKIFSEEERKKIREMFNATKGNKISISKTENDENNFYGLGFKVFKKEEKFWFSYSSAMHGGGSIIHQISEAEYMDMRSNKLSLSIMVKRYPERDGDRQRSLEIEKRWGEAN